MEKIKNKLRRLKASNTIIKFFKSSSNGNGRYFSGNSEEILNIRHTKETQSFRKPCLSTDNDKKPTHTATTKILTKDNFNGPTPMSGNQTIIEGKLILDNLKRR